jgi:hypothetical protein
MHDAGEGSPALDIKALLQVALERAPHGDVEARVMARVALATTALEFARLIFAAPVRWLVDDAPREAQPEGDDAGAR